MVYNEKLVASVKCNGKVLREDKDTVYLPFGSEYSILLKNMNTKDALVDVTVDDRAIVSNLIVRSNNDVELERFVDSMDKGYKLKFIEKTDDISECRGDKPEDGLIRITYSFEKPKKTYEDYNPWKYYNDYSRGITWDNFYTPYNFLSSNIYTKDLGYNTVRCCSVDYSNDKGITVEGNDSYQSFTHGNIGELEKETHVIVIQLKGSTKHTKISKPLEVKDKIECNYCGKKSKSNKRFCSNCGARLIIE